MSNKRLETARNLLGIAAITGGIIYGAILLIGLLALTVVWVITGNMVPFDFFSDLFATTIGRGSVIVWALMTLGLTAAFDNAGALDGQKQEKE